MVKRSDFVKTIKDFQGISFMNKCQASLNSNFKKSNEWFDPISPLASISSTEICSLHQKLFTSLSKRNIASISDLIFDVSGRKSGWRLKNDPRLLRKEERLKSELNSTISPTMADKIWLYPYWKSLSSAVFTLFRLTGYTSWFSWK